jgi:predicted transcriptional regulator
MSLRFSRIKSGTVEPPRKATNGIQLVDGARCLAESREGRRSRVEIIADVLRRLHYAWKTEKAATAYLLEKQLGLQGKRLRELLQDLRRLHLIDDQLKLTERGYTYLEEYTSKVLPFLEKFGLRTRRDLRSHK